MLKWIKHLSLRTRILVLPFMFALGLIAMAVMNYGTNREIMDRVVYPNFEEQLLSANKSALKALVEAETTALAAKLKNLGTREEKIAATVAETDPIRFFDDGSGYYFTYDLSGIRINVPINKAQNGKNLIDLQDQKGNRFVEEIVKVAKSGGGFVEYYFEKPGKGIQPKLSYIKAIPGTDFLIGTGVYIDNVVEEKSALQRRVDDKTKSYLQYAFYAFALLLALTIVASLFIARSVKGALQTVITGLSAGSQQIGSACARIGSSSRQLAEGASEQAAAIEETSSSIEEMSSMTRQNADNADQANQLMRNTNNVVASATECMNRLTATMGEISHASEETQKIIKTIDEIAFQTNLLALNAAVEAARAGEAGAGFAVVADEVRNLAMRAAEAAKNTAGLIEGTVNKIKEGAELVGKTHGEFSQVSAGSVKMGELVGEIAAASREQAQGIEQISRAVTGMDKVVQQNAGNAEESAASSEDLEEQASKMREYVSDLAALAGSAGREVETEAAPASKKAGSQSRELVVTGKAASGVKKDQGWDNKRPVTGKNLSRNRTRSAGDGNLCDF